MSAPPMGMMRVMPKTKAQAGDGPEGPVRLVHGEIDDQADDHGEDQKIEHMPRRQNDRRARHVAVELGEGDERAGEGDGADGDAQAHFDQALGADGVASRADAEGLGRIKRRARGQAPRPGRPANGTPPPVAACRSWRCAAPSPRRCRRRWPGRRSIMPQVNGSVTPATHRVVRTAMVMPIMPLRLPAREVAGEDRPLSARMNSTPATR